MTVLDGPATANPTFAQFDHISQPGSNGMPYCTQQKVSENARAAERAKAVLKSGDRLLVATCGNSRGTTVTMTGWSKTFPDFIASKTMEDDELHPINVRKVNGVPTSFADPAQQERNR